MNTKEARRMALNLLQECIDRAGCKTYTDCEVWGKAGAIQYGKRRGWFEIKSWKDKMYGNHLTRVICKKRAYNVLYLANKKIQRTYI